MTSGRTGHWIKMRRSRAPFSGSDLSIHTRSLADFITIMCGFRFSVHTGLVGRAYRSQPTLCKWSGSSNTRAATCNCSTSKACKRHRANVMPPSGHSISVYIRTRYQIPLWVISGLMQRSNWDRYSITSSARPNSVAGSLNPSSFAVLMRKRPVRPRLRRCFALVQCTVSCKAVAM